MSNKEININLDDYARRMNQMKFSPKLFQLIIIVLIALVLLTTSWFTIEPEEVGVVVRFGKFVRTVEPGLHFKIPFGVEVVEKVPVKRQLKEEFGFRTLQAGIRSSYEQRGYEDESLMLTGDLNSAVVEWTVQYRVSDPYKKLFKVREPEQTLRDISESIMREVVGDRTVNEVLTVGRQEIAAVVEQRVQEMCDKYETGFKIEQVVLQDVNPPDPVKPSFNAVNEAQQEREKLINQARSEYNRVIPKAMGEAEQVIQQARGYALDRVNRAKGDSARFQAVYQEYKKSPEVTRQRIYLETLNQILPQSGQKVIIDADAANVIPLLDLDQKVKGEPK